MKVLSSLSEYVNYINDYKEFLIKNGYSTSKVPELESSLLNLKNKEFPYFLILKAAYEVHDALHEFIWEKFGEPHLDSCGCCYSYYNFCPKIDEQSIVCDCEGEKYLFYKDVPDHKHNGDWTSIWLTKSGYDFGFGAILFKNKDLYEKCLNEIRNFNFEVFSKEKKERVKKMIETKNALQVFKSRWGFHPISKEDCFKLKKLSIVYLKSLRLAAAHRRLMRKLPHNRKQQLPENPSPLFFENKNGYWIDKGVGKRMFDFYRTARKPQDMEDIIFNEEFSKEKISSLFDLI
ncbi:MAG: hypothetical protein EKK64_04380 [Neisseriaceae bacterium]|nr:MAG: hypothetical protein EKK64_04380 [Neisseriaceae bacterium]